MTLADQRTDRLRCGAIYLCFGLYMLPGHLNRMTDPTEMNLYLPEFANWSIGKKLYRGYSSTVANVFIQDKIICLLFFYLPCWQGA